MITISIAVNKVSRRKSILWEKLKATSLEETLKKWKEHLKNLLGNPSVIIDKHAKEIIHG